MEYSLKKIRAFLPAGFLKHRTAYVLYGERENDKFQMQPAAAFFGVKSEYFFRAASDIEFCVFPRLDSSRGVSDKPQTMSGFPSVPSGTASQTI